MDKQMFLLVLFSSSALRPTPPRPQPQKCRAGNFVLVGSSGKESAVFPFFKPSPFSLLLAHYQWHEFPLCKEQMMAVHQHIPTS